jgi:hypothetical protein
VYAVDHLHRGSARCRRWTRAEEFNVTERIWAIPPSRAKRRGKRKAMPFRVPLSDAAVTIVERIGVKEGLLFPGVNHKSLAKIGGAETSTHGLRATFKTWAEEQTSHANEIIEIGTWARGRRRNRGSL